MCGILGFIGKKVDFSDSKINRMLNVLSHRGPDSTNFLKNDKIIFGHTRLKIIDLKDNANQPMISNCRSLIITFNGEIYNYLELKNELSRSYEFKTNGDTEVILAAWKKWDVACISKLSGMFAFTIYNTKTNEAYLVRDRFGQKPIFYQKDKNSLFFSSELKPFFYINKKF